MYSLEQRKRAVEPCIKYGLKATAAIRELGYPSRAQLVSWHREWQENGGRLTDRSLGQCTLEQKRAAVRHCLAHGRCNALARREPGCPKCTAKPAERTGGHAPGERRATQLPQGIGLPASSQRSSALHLLGLSELSHAGPSCRRRGISPPGPSSGRIRSRCRFRRRIPFMAVFVAWIAWASVLFMASLILSGNTLFGDKHFTG